MSFDVLDVLMMFVFFVSWHFSGRKVAYVARLAYD